MTDCSCDRISAVIADRISECVPFVMDALTLGQEGRAAAEEAGAAAAEAFSCCCCCCCFGKVRPLVPPRAAVAAATLMEM